MNIDKVYGYDESIDFNSSYVVDFVSGFEFAPVWRKDSIYDAREFKPIYNYIFTIDFSDYEYAPNPYYNGKIINAVLGFGTVRYESDKYGDGERNNVRYLLLECDGRIESFVNSVTFLENESNLDDDEIDEVNVEVSFDNIDKNAYYDSFNDYSLISRVNGTLVDQDKTIIGLNYGRPISHKVTCGYVISDPKYPSQRSLKMFFFQDMALYRGKLETSSGKYERSVEPQNMERYISDSLVSIKSPHELVEPYLKSYKLYRNEMGDSVMDGKNRRNYAGKGWESVFRINSWFYNKCYTVVSHQFWNSDDEMNDYVKKSPLILELQLISFGDGWKPYEIDYTGCPEFTSSKGKKKTIVNEKHRNYFFFCFS